MAFSPGFCHPFSLKVNCIGHPIRFKRHNAEEQRFASVIGSMSCKSFGLQGGMKADLYSNWSFLRGSRVVLTPKVSSLTQLRKGFQVHASWLTTSQIASSAFTVGTVTVLPFYTLMVLAPKAQLTKKVMESSIPYVVLGVAYAYLLYLSWTPDTIRLMFASKYLLPELPGMVKMFSSEVTLASAWIHLLAIDLFAARQVFQDGLENQIETRHSVSFCLLFCPVGILAHVITKALTKSSSGSKQRVH